MRGGGEGREEVGRDARRRRRAWRGREGWQWRGSGKGKEAGKVEGGLDLDICPAAAEFL